MSLRVRISMLGYLLTAWGRLRAGDYVNMRRMRIPLPRATRAAELGETQERPEYCPLPVARRAGGIGHS